MRRRSDFPFDPVQDSCAAVLGALAVVLAANGCAPAEDPEELASHSSLYALVTTIDGTYFYPPLGPEPSPGRSFDPTLLDRLQVVLEAEDGDAAVRTLATFSARTRPGLVLLAENELYWMNVPAATYFADPTLTYRFRVLLDGREIGRSDMSSRIFELMSYVPSLPVGVKLRVEGRPAPSVLSISPAGAIAGTDVTLTVTGADFSADSVVRFAGRDLATTLRSSTSLVATLPAALLPAAGGYGVRVFTPSPGGGSSREVTFAASAPGPIAIDTLDIAA